MNHAQMHQASIELPNEQTSHRLGIAVEGHVGDTGITLPRQAKLPARSPHPPGECRADPSRFPRRRDAPLRWPRYSSKRVRATSSVSVRRRNGNCLPLADSPACGVAVKGCGCRAKHGSGREGDGWRSLRQSAACSVTPPPRSAGAMPPLRGSPHLSFSSHIIIPRR